ncbi:MAG: hypothetical protein M1831_000903 [Alyxoria varia]|nr:MAG: hypothetical protein M1831_000903 [Alyxoria varia]
MDGRGGSAAYPAEFRLEQVQVAVEKAHLDKRAIDLPYSEPFEPEQLTPAGFATCRRNGESLRALYIDRLALLPNSLNFETSPNQVLKVRSTQYRRTIDSAREVLAALYLSPEADGANSDGRELEIEVRDLLKDTLLPGYQESDTLRRIESEHLEWLMASWQDSDDAVYVRDLLMPWISSSIHIDGGEIDVKALFDTVASVKALPSPEDRLPPPFFDGNLYKILEEWSSKKEHGLFADSPQYQSLAVGPLLEEISNKLRYSSRTVNSVIGSGDKNCSNGVVFQDGTESTARFWLNACHDTTLAAIMCSLGIMGPQTESGFYWPSFGDVLAIELFSETKQGDRSIDGRYAYVRLLYNGNAQNIPALDKQNEAVASEDADQYSANAQESKYAQPDRGMCTLTKLPEVEENSYK